MINPQTLSEFVQSPDANEIMNAFTAIPTGPIRSAMVSHLATMAMASAGQASPSYRSESDERPLLAETKDNRIIERKLRNQTLEAIAEAEDVSVDEVRRVLIEASKKGVRVGRIKGAPSKQPAKKMPLDDRKARLKRATQLRYLGMSPSQIAKRLGISPSNVSGAIWKARSTGVIFPDIDNSLTWESELDEDSVVFPTENQTVSGEISAPVSPDDSPPEASPVGTEQFPPPT